MKKYIVTTTINSPTKALIKYSKMDEWTLIVVGDKKTPHKMYDNVDCIYLSPEKQQELYPELSDALGWNCIQRRNIGFLEAYRLGADIIATVDDDNIPKPGWGKNLVVGQTIDIDTYEANEVFDALSVTEYSHLWHRGYPVELLSTKNEIKYLGKLSRKVLVQADLWDGDPDVDAIARITFKPIVKFLNREHFSSTKPSPFNSQNTFVYRDAIPYYFMFPFIGRMDDIWASYYLQSIFPNSVVFGESSVYHDRNTHNLIDDIELEMIGYRNTYDFVKNLKDYVENKLPEKSILAWKEYQKIFKELK